jgi:gluconate 5-dehydrogenase
MDDLARFRLDGLVALVPGGAGGIGLRICEAFACAGARVAVAGRTSETLERAVQAVEAAGSTGLGIRGDMTRREDADRAVAETIAALGRLDILVNAVGGGAGDALYPAESYPEDAWDWIIDLNVKGALFPSQAAARAMIEAARGGRILNISSVRGQLALNAPYSAYVAAKHALNGITKQHATEWAKHRIRVNAISPTFVRTPQVASLLADPDFEAGIVARIPLGRIAEPDDIVGAALFFCSDASAFVTGQILTLDGGLTATQ